jgi:hypothetical protein
MIVPNLRETMGEEHPQIAGQGVDCTHVKSETADFWGYQLT